MAIVVQAVLYCWWTLLPIVRSATSNTIPLAFFISKRIGTRGMMSGSSVSQQQLPSTSSSSHVRSGEDVAKNSGVLVIGSANQDLTCYTSTFPVAGETVFGQRFTMSCGGKGANQANAAASIYRPITMICHLGPDVFGQTIRSNFQRRGVQVIDPNLKDDNNDDGESPATTTTTTGVAMIVVDTSENGENRIVVIPGANQELTPSLVRESLQRLHNQPPSVLLVQLEIPLDTAFAALGYAKQTWGTQVLTILNPAPAPSEKAALERFYPYVDILIPNQTELRILCGRNVHISSENEGDDDGDDEEGMALSLLQKGIGRAVIVTLGARGALVVEKLDGSINSSSSNINHRSTYVEVPNNLPGSQDPIIDTVGAGDGFCGALAAYLASSSSLSTQSSTEITMDITQATKLACGFASLSVRRAGATFPTAEELPECLRVGIPYTQATRDAANGRTMPRKLTFVTGNKKKLEEVQKILGDGNTDSSDDSFPYEIVNRSVDLPELQGDAIDIAREKCRLAVQAVQGPCFTEDTSLCFNALNGMPGPYIKWFLEHCGHDGLNRMLIGFDDHTAIAQTIIAFSPGPEQITRDGNNDDNIHVFVGHTHGKIVPARGSLDFGWDPIFEPNEGHGKTYAEMSKEAKNTISHRGRALAKFREFLVTGPRVV